jgi:hypothetical protein
MLFCIALVTGNTFFGAFVASAFEDTGHPEVPDAAQVLANVTALTQRTLTGLTSWVGLNMAWGQKNGAEGYTDMVGLMRTVLGNLGNLEKFFRGEEVLAGGEQVNLGTARASISALLESINQVEEIPASVVPEGATELKETLTALQDILANFSQGIPVEQRDSASWAKLKAAWTAQEREIARLQAEIARLRASNPSMSGTPPCA